MSSPEVLKTSNSRLIPSLPKSPSHTLWGSVFGTPKGRTDSEMFVGPNTYKPKVFGRLGNILYPIIYGVLYMINGGWPYSQAPDLAIFAILAFDLRDARGPWFQVVFWGAVLVGLPEKICPPEPEKTPRKANWETHIFFWRPFFFGPWLPSQWNMK